MSVCSKSQLFCNIKKGWTTKNAMTSHRQQIPFRYSYMIFIVLLGKTKLANIALKRFQSRVPTLAFIIRRPWTLSTEVFLRSDREKYHPGIFLLLCGGEERIFGKPGERYETKWPTLSPVNNLINMLFSNGCDNSNLNHMISYYFFIHLLPHVMQRREELQWSSI